MIGNMRRWIQRFVTDEGGASPSWEYAVFAVFITLGCAIVLTLVYQGIRNIFVQPTTQINTTT